MVRSGSTVVEQAAGKMTTCTWGALSGGPVTTTDHTTARQDHRPQHSVETGALSPLYALHPTPRTTSAMGCASPRSSMPFSLRKCSIMRGMSGANSWSAGGRGGGGTGRGRGGKGVRGQGGQGGLGEVGWEQGINAVQYMKEQCSTIYERLM